MNLGAALGTGKRNRSSLRSRFVTLVFWALVLPGDGPMAIVLADLLVCAHCIASGMAEKRSV